MVAPVRSHKGGARPTTLASSMSPSDMAFTVAAGGGTGYPDGTNGVFVITFDATLAGEEKVLCSARTGDTFTVATGGRGYDNTVASSHAAPSASVMHTLSAVELQEANDHIVATTNVHGIPDTTAIITASSTQTLTNKTLGSGTVLPAGTVDASSAQTLTNKTLGSGTVLPAGTVDTTSAQTLTNKTLGSGTVLPATVVDTTSAQTLSNKTLTTPTISNLTNMQHTHTGATSGGVVSGGSSYPTEPAWTNASLGNGSNVGGTNQVVQYKKVNNEVRIRGAITGISFGTPIFTLPAGSRPVSYDQVGPVGHADGSTNPAYISVTTGGDVYIGQSGGGTVNYAWIAYSFYVD